MSQYGFTEALIAEEKASYIPEEEDIWRPFLGAWDFDWVDHRKQEHEQHIKGEWIFSRVLSGGAVQDIFIVPSRAEYESGNAKKNEYGTTLRFYNVKSKCWEVFYGCHDEATRLQAHKTDSEIVLTEICDGNMKWVFSDIKENSFHWQNRQFKNNQWITIIDLYATRKHSI